MTTTIPLASPCPCCGAADATTTATTTTTCPTCLGISTTLSSRLTDALRQAVAPYVGRDAASSSSSSSNHDTPNRWSRQYREMVLPGDLLVRGPGPTPPTAARWWKTWAAATLDACLSATIMPADNTTTTTTTPDSSTRHPPVKDDLYECGALGVHVLVLPAPHVARPACVARSVHPPKQGRRRRRFVPGGHQMQQQGGDPRQNLEQRVWQLQQQKTRAVVTVWTLNQATAAHVSESERHALRNHPSVRAGSSSSSTKHPSAAGTTTTKCDTQSSSSSPIPAYDIYVAVWRRPLYVQGAYTKTRRDVSQTPFFVDRPATAVRDQSTTTDGDVPTQGRRKRQRLGVTSVEEAIVPAVVQHCGGVSTQNNDPTSSSRVVYGMAKFHASGREDMNVRMLLPDPQVNCIPRSSHHHDDVATDNLPPPKITGRPFVCQVVDAHRIPTATDLARIVADINHVSLEHRGDCRSSTSDNDINHDTMLTADGRSYGNNPLGVGIAPDLRLVPARAFSQLQAETEDKVKYYGCLCWSARVLPPSHEALARTLGTTAFPLTTAQRTPIRVLHRRSNLVRHRRVLSCTPQRLDEHYFRLHLSTEAGTYVKEFVHGDLGRTHPSIASILGDKTDILELDCEGVELGRS